MSNGFIFFLLIFFYCWIPASSWLLVLLRFGYGIMRPICQVVRSHLVLPNEETSPYILLETQDQRLGEEQDQLPCESTGTSSGNCQETEICVVSSCHMPRQPLQNHPSGHLGGWATPWSAEEMLNGQHQRVSIPAAHNCSQEPPAKKTGRGSLPNHLS